MTSADEVYENSKPYLCYRNRWRCYCIVFYILLLRVKHWIARLSYNTNAFSFGWSDSKLTCSGARFHLQLPMTDKIKNSQFDLRWNVTTALMKRHLFRIARKTIAYIASTRDISLLAPSIEAISDRTPNVKRLDRMTRSARFRVKRGNVGMTSQENAYTSISPASISRTPESHPRWL